MARIKCVVAYDGYNYMGFQIQGNLDTIEKRITDAIFSMTLDKVKIYSSGRTDRYVHARGQVFHFDTNKEVSNYGWTKGINAFLPSDIVILSSEIVNEDFHARFSAIKKEYHYYITEENDVFKNRYSSYIYNLDFKLIEEAIPLFIGTHNFKGFCSLKVDLRKDFVKTIYEAKVIKHEKDIEFVFIGNGFLKYQVRRMVGLLIEIGQRKSTKNKINEVIESGDPTISHFIAEGKGLFLEKVYYGN